MGATYIGCPCQEEQIESNESRMMTCVVYHNENSVVG